MAHLHFSREHKLMIVICISASFFLLEIVVGFRQHSLALVADAFHVCSDLVGFAVALVAIKKTREHRSNAPRGFSFGWQRAELLGAFFNGGESLFVVGPFSFSISGVTRVSDS